MFPGWSQISTNPHMDSAVYGWVAGREHGVTLRVTVAPTGITVFGPSSNMHIEAPVRVDRSLDATIALADFLFRLADPDARHRGRTLATEVTARGYATPLR